MQLLKERIKKYRYVLDLLVLKPSSGVGGGSNTHTFRLKLSKGGGGKDLKLYLRYSPLTPNVLRLVAMIAPYIPETP